MELGLNPAQVPNLVHLLSQESSLSQRASLLHDSDGSALVFPTMHPVIYRTPDNCSSHPRDYGVSLPLHRAIWTKEARSRVECR